MTVTEQRRATVHVRLVRAVSCATGGPRPGGRRARRAHRRARAWRPAPMGVATAAAARAALAAAGQDSRRGWATVAVWALALAGHAALAMAVWRSDAAPPVLRRPTRITVQVHEAPLRPPLPARSAEATRRPGPPHPVARLAPPPRPSQPAARPPAPVKVVGLSLESTSEAGPGPAFAAGDTLAGTTAATATRAAPAPSLVRSSGPNRAAPGAPRPGSLLTPPRRLQEVKPRYPDARRAAGVEADVLLVVSLDDTGTVRSVTVGRSSGDQAFDEAACQAARQERFSPALRDGVPVSTTFTFTTHFRLDTP